MKKKRSFTLLNILPYLILLVSSIAVIILKQNYMVDEIYSYGLANHTDGIRIVFEDGHTYVPASKPYMDYMSVSEFERFDYANVWLNQTNDVHPPLYYAILHTICSVFPGQFSRYFAGGINIVFAFLSLWALRACIRCFKADEKTLLFMSLAYAVSPGILNNITFFRMYVMAMSFVTLIYLVYLKQYLAYENNEIKGRAWFYPILGILAFLGALTHYYVIIFTVAVSFVFAIWQLMKKRWGNVIGVVIVGILSGTAAWLSFPAMIDHVFHGYRGEQSMNNLKISFAETLTRLKEFFIKVDAQLFGGFALLVLAIGLIYLLALKYGRRKIRRSRNAVFPFVLLWISLLIYFVFVGKSAVYISDRYMFPVYTLLLLGVCLPLILAVRRTSSKTALFLEALVLIEFTCMAYYRSTWPYMYMESAKLINAAKQHSEADCIYIYDDDWKTQPSFAEVSQYRSVTFINEGHIELLDEVTLNPENGLAVLISSDQEDLITEVIHRFPQFTKMIHTGFYGYAESYYLYRDEAGEDNPA